MKRGGTPACAPAGAQTARHAATAATTAVPTSPRRLIRGKLDARRTGVKRQPRRHGASGRAGRERLKGVPGGLALMPPVDQAGAGAPRAVGEVVLRVLPVEP